MASETRGRFAATLLAFCAVIATAQAQTTPEQTSPNLRAVRPLAMRQTRYRLRAGESTRVDASAETLDFLLHAKTRRLEIDGKEAHGIVVGPNRAGDQISLAASLRMKPGEYTVKLSAIAEASEERMTTLAVTLDPMQTVPSTATQPPVVLLNGWQFGVNLDSLNVGSCPESSGPSDTFGTLAGDLQISNGVPVVYFFDNCVEDPNGQIEDLGNVLGQVLGLIRYDTGALVPQVDLVAHSMGGLIARAYLSGLQDSGSSQPPVNPRIRKVVLIATPNFGSFLAENWASSIPTGTQSAEMIPGSALLWNLARWNQGGDDLRGVDALAIIGNKGYEAQFSSSPPANASDGVVSVSSASLGFARDATRTRILPYCHEDFSEVDQLVVDCEGSGIAEAPETELIVESFLANTPNWMSIGGTPATDFYLSQYGGAYFAVETAADQYLKDISSVSWGNVSFSDGGATNIVFYNEFVAGMATFEAASYSLGSVTDGPVTVFAGGYSTFRRKLSPEISSVMPLLANAPGWVVQSGTTITINGVGFGQQQCSGCQVIAAAPGSTTGYPLPVSSWTDRAISASFLPATMPNLTTPGLVTIYVELSSSAWDSINIMAAPAPSIAVAPTSLQFAYAVGGAVPAAQSIQATNSGGGTLTWTAVPSASWLGVSPASGTAPSTLSVLVSPAGLGAGKYTGSVQISAGGASNSPVTISVTLTVAPAPASLAVSPQTLTFNYTAGGAVPVAQGVSVTNASGGALPWTVSSNATWLTVSPASGSAPSTLSVSVNPTSLTAGPFSGVVTVSSPGVTSQTVNVALTVNPAAAVGPQITVAGVINAATSLAGGIAPNEYISIWGAGLGPSTGGYSGPMTTLASGTRVYIGGTAAPIVYSSATQVNALVPFGIAGTAATSIQAEYNGVNGNAVTVPVVDSSPGILTQGYGPGQAWVLNQDQTFNSASNPAPRNTYVAFWATGQGLVDIPQQDGTQPTGPPFPNPLLPVSVSLGGVTIPDANLVFNGLVYSGEIQLNVLIPDNAPTGGAVPLVLTIGAASSRAGVTIAIK
jgi:uncharacterized protein (TIGR03437 family)